MSLNLFNGVILCHWPKEASPRGGASGRTWSEDFDDRYRTCSNCHQLSARKIRILCTYIIKITPPKINMICTLFEKIACRF